MSSTSHGIVHFSTTLLLLLSCAGAQPTPNDKPNDPYGYSTFTPSLAIIIVILIAAVFFMGFFSVYIRQCSGTRTANLIGSVRPNNLIGRSRRANNRTGLASETIESFPIFAYSEVKDSKIGKGALECAVCLNEFEDDVTLRLLPKCDHVFHPPCIDAWLASHTTCPVCRADLEVTAGEVIVVAPIESINDDFQNSVSVRLSDEPIGDDDPVQQGPGTAVLDRSRSLNQNRPSRSRSLKSIFISKFPRSHSTGHSVIQPGENVDRFTLRLPDDVRKEIMSRALNRTTSLLILPRESSTRFGYRIFKRLDSLDPVGKSDRWVFSMAPPFFTRAPSLRSSKRMENDGEGTSAMTPSGFITALKKSFGRLNSKGSENSLASADSVRPPV